LVAKRLILFRCITLPLLAPSIASGFLFVFLLALVEFAVPSLLQVNVYAVEIFGRFSASYDSAEAAAQALPLLMGGAAIVAGWALWIRPRQGRLPGRASGSALRPSAGWAWRVGVAWSWVLVSGASFLPLGLLFRQSLPLSSYREVWQTAHDEIASSLLLAALSATALTVLALAMAYLSRTRSITARAYLSSLLPFLVSGPLLGIGFILVWNRPGMPSWIYDTPAVLVLACVARLLFFAYLALRAALHDLPPRLEEAASVLGVPWWRQVFGILIPLASPVIVGVWGLGFVFSLRELDTAVLVAPPGWTPLSVRLFGLMHYGPSRFVAALSVVTAAIILFAAILTTVVYSTARRVIDARR
jgi:ABC-type Fe3+ transport system permease subunit